MTSVSQRTPGTLRLPQDERAGDVDSLGTGCPRGGGEATGMRRTLIAAAGLAGLLALAPIHDAPAAPVLPAARSAEPVVLTGAQLPDWSQLPAVGVANPNPIAGRTTD